MADLSLVNSDAPLPRQGKKTFGGLEFTHELRSLAKSILELSPPDLANAKSADESLDISVDDGSPSDWIPIPVVSRDPNDVDNTCLGSAVSRALAPMSREDATASLKSALEDSSSPFLPLKVAKAMGDMLKAFERQCPGDPQTALFRSRLEKALVSSSLKFDVHVQEMSR